MQDFTGAVERILAYHEVGHALVAPSIRGADLLKKVSIVPRGIGALGYPMQRPMDDRFLMSRQGLEDKMTVPMGGRAAETLLGSDISTWAADDLARATDIARGMVLRFGMGSKLGPVAWDKERGQDLDQQQGALWRQRWFSEETAHEIDVAVRRRLERALDRAVTILDANQDALDERAANLLAHETLMAEALPEVRGVTVLEPAG